MKKCINCSWDNDNDQNVCEKCGWVLTDPNVPKTVFQFPLAQKYICHYNWRCPIWCLAGSNVADNRNIFRMHLYCHWVYY